MHLQHMHFHTCSQTLVVKNAYATYSMQTHAYVHTCIIKRTNMEMKGAIGYSCWK